MSSSFTTRPSINHPGPLFLGTSSSTVSSESISTSNAFGVFSSVATASASLSQSTSSSSSSSASAVESTISSSQASFSSSPVSTSVTSTTTAINAKETSFSASSGRARSSSSRSRAAATSPTNNLLSKPSDAADVVTSASETSSTGILTFSAAPDTAPTSSSFVSAATALSIPFQAATTLAGSISIPTTSLQPLSTSGINNSATGNGSELGSSSRVNVPVVAGVTSALGAVLLALVAAVLVVRRRSRRQTNAWRDRLLGGRMFAASPASSPSLSATRRAPFGLLSPFSRPIHNREPSFPIQEPQMEEARASYRPFGGKHQVSDSLTRPLAASVEPQWDMVVGPSDYGGTSIGGGGTSGTGGGGGSGNGGGGSNNISHDLAPPKMVIEGHDSFYASDPFAAPPPTVIPDPSAAGHGGTSGSVSTFDSLYSQDPDSSPPGRGASPYAM
ncbi:hypothetical protein K488DRAFT_86472 [Vararia minispora EC-137]|uniref:Uncharacterized protein n=1 Tax=Vararia minispora EC-137 TaxID=1314806 RepID=A0ACB8QJB1_9AGAM|nr:hypothetical protein K488DRAFT_86472 [Vararia minispora EC-137]